MKKILLCLMVLVSCTAMAQDSTANKDDDGDDPYDTKTYFMYGINYLSDNVYLGRKDSMVIPYISPYIGYHLKWGFTAKAMMSLAAIPKGSLKDLITIEGSYDHSFGEHINTGACIDKYFYDGNSSSIRASTVASASLYWQYGNDWIEPQVNLNGDLNHSSSDYSVGVQVDHNFQFVKKTLSILPTIAMNSGTQNYYDEYYKTRLTRHDKTIKVDKTVTDAKKFKALDYEFSTVVSYRVTKWLFNLTMTYAVPVNASTLTLPKNLGIKEKLVNSFFVQLDICHR